MVPAGHAEHRAVLGLANGASHPAYEHSRQFMIPFCGFQAFYSNCFQVGEWRIIMSINSTLEKNPFF
jgi:hypothetical protein